MKSSVKPFRPELEKLMADARERIAIEKFDIVRVKGELAAAAKDGHSSCIIRIDGPIDLRQTPSTLILQKWLEKENLSMCWLRRPLGNHNGDAAWDVIITWSTENIYSDIV